MCALVSHIKKNVVITNNVCHVCINILQVLAKNSIHTNHYSYNSLREFVHLYKTFFQPFAMKNDALYYYEIQTYIKN